MPVGLDLKPLGKAASPLLLNAHKGFLKLFNPGFQPTVLTACFSFFPAYLPSEQVCILLSTHVSFLLHQSWELFRLMMFFPVNI